MKQISINTTISVLSKDELSQEETSLMSQAFEARSKAYAPYSKFTVGAAILLDNGIVVQGSNQENAAYPSGLCAERVAIFKAISEGNRQISAIAVVTCNGGSPCGACRQVMREFSDLDMPVILADDEGRVVFESTMDGILPRSFGPEDLEK